jgi:hypothetical protein
VGALVLNRAPTDPFDPAERTFVDTWIGAETKVLGARSLRRIDRAAKARARIASHFAGLLFQTPELASDDGLAIRLSEAFARGAS